MSKHLTARRVQETANGKQSVGLGIKKVDQNKAINAPRKVARNGQRLTGKPQSSYRVQPQTKRTWEQAKSKEQTADRSKRLSSKDDQELTAQKMINILENNKYFPHLYDPYFDRKDVK